MGNDFVIDENEHWVRVQNISPYAYIGFSLYVNHRYIGSYYTNQNIFLNKALFFPGRNHLFITTHTPMPNNFSQEYSFIIEHPSNKKETSTLRNRDFRAGDILVASDNVNSFFTGYMGHSAIIVDENTLIESPGGHPAIVEDGIDQFLYYHPHHTHFRPYSAELGEKSAAYARDYYAKYVTNLENGIEKPIFSFSLLTSLDDPWKTVYCSKLVWLCYYYGAHYTFKNDFLWFSPEDLYSNLEDNDDFELLYQHPKFNFKLNT